MNLEETQARQSKVEGADKLERVPFSNLPACWLL